MISTNKRGAVGLRRALLAGVAAMAMTGALTLMAPDAAKAANCTNATSGNA